MVFQLNKMKKNMKKILKKVNFLPETKGYK